MPKSVENIVFATSNNGKIATLKRVLEDAHVDVTIEQRALDLIEPQADTALEVAQSKARQAYKLIGHAVLVDDSSFHIEALNGFPGPYAKYVNDTVGIEGYLQMMKDASNRRGYFLNNLVYVDDEGGEHVFDSAPFAGEIVETVEEVDDPTAWSLLFQLFKPDGSDKVLAQMSMRERSAAKGRVVTRDAYVEFAAWLKAHHG